MKLNESNYYSREANQEYMSVSLLKEFLDTPYSFGCEKRALAIMNGEYQEDDTDALLIGSYVDTALLEPQRLDEFKASHPQLFSTRGATKGQLKSQYKKADAMVDRCKKDKFFMKTLEGEHQRIMTAEIFGVPFKIKMDVYKEGKYITDLKTTQDIHKGFWSLLDKRRVSFIEYYDYILQGAVYQEVVYKNTGQRLPFFISAVDKGNIPDIEVIQIDNETLAEKLELYEELIIQAWQVHQGELEAQSCCLCDYCKMHKVLQSPINYLEIGGELV